MLAVWRYHRHESSKCVCGGKARQCFTSLFSTYRSFTCCPEMWWLATLLKDWSGLGWGDQWGWVGSLGSINCPVGPPILVCIRYSPTLSVQRIWPRHTRCKLLVLYWSKTLEISCESLCYSKCIRYVICVVCPARRDPKTMRTITEGVCLCASHVTMVMRSHDPDTLLPTQYARFCWR